MRVDTLRGGEGADDLSGGAEGDDLDGEGDEDDLTGDEGDDSLDGGTGNDRFARGRGPRRHRGRCGRGHGDVPARELRRHRDHARRRGERRRRGRAGQRPLRRPGRHDGERRHPHQRHRQRGRQRAHRARDHQHGHGRCGQRLLNATCYPNCSFDQGADKVDGGPGNDEIHTGTGADPIIGGPGPDEIYADNCSSNTCSQPDLIDVADGEHDTVYCGGGGDVVTRRPGRPTAAVRARDARRRRPTSRPHPRTTPRRHRPRPRRRPRATTPNALHGAEAAQAHRSPRQSKRLKAAGCRVGKIRKPRGAGARRLVVRKQSRRAGSTVPRSTKVNLTPAPRSRA